MKIKTSELTGAALDWAVAKCEGHLDANRVVVDLEYCSGHDPVRWEPQLSTYYSSAYAPSTEWKNGGPIIEREKLTVEYTGDPDTWCACIKADEEVFGPTPLIAAMRCYVASRLGDAVEVPEALKE